MYEIKLSYQSPKFNLNKGYDSEFEFNYHESKIEFCLQKLEQITNNPNLKFY